MINLVPGVNVVEYEEEIELNAGKRSVHYTTTKESRFLIWDKVVNEVSVTDENGETQELIVHKIGFEVGEEWKVDVKGTRITLGNKNEVSDNINSYTIIGPEEEIKELSTNFSTLFEWEFAVE